MSTIRSERFRSLIGHVWHAAARARFGWAVLLLASPAVAQQTRHADYESADRVAVNAIQLPSNWIQLVSDVVELETDPLPSTVDQVIPSSSDLPAVPAAQQPADESRITESLVTESLITESLTTAVQPPPAQDASNGQRAAEDLPAAPTAFPDAGDAAAAFPPPARRPALGAVAAGLSATPALIGDDFGSVFLLAPGNDTLIAVAGGDRRFKITENVSPIPRDRVFFNFNHFHNHAVDANGNTQDRDRFTMGFEKTFLDRNASFEMRLPISNALNSTQRAGDRDTTSGEVGNLAMAIKAVLWRDRDSVLAAGTTLTVPTGDDYRLFSGGGALLFQVDNDSVHIGPYLGFLHKPAGDWFAQGFLQVDVDLNGNDVRTGGGFQGTLQDQNLLFADLSLGRWLHRNRTRRGALSATAAIAELHYTSTLNDPDNVAGITNPLGRVDILNATGALHWMLGQSTFRVAAAAPLRDDGERTFDSEIIVQWNRMF